MRPGRGRVTGDLRTRAQAAEHSEDVGTNGSANPTLGDVISARYGRREILKGGLAAAAISAALPPLIVGGASSTQAESADPTPSFRFKEISALADDKHAVAEGYDAHILICWGDPVLPGAPPFNPLNQTAEAQARQFGYNNDYLGYIPLDGSRRGLLVVNHEYTNEDLMFPGVGRQDTRDPRVRTQPFAKMTKEIAAIEKMAHGGSVLEVARAADGTWSVVPDSRYARRITAETPMEITGPAAGHERLRTSADPTGRKVLGMLNNCAGGTTPWGTWLTCEENIHGYFWGSADGLPEEKALKRYGIPGRWYNWVVYDDRFDVDKEPN